MITGKCLDSQIPGYQFKTHYDCAIAGYALAGESLKLLSEEPYYYGLDRINEERLAIKFECKELKGA